MSQSRPAIPDPAEIAGRYEVLRKLGAGAFGTVYLARDKILGRTVAIKTIRLDGLAAGGTGLDELLDRFKREARVSAQLKHPNIVTIYDIGDVEGMSYLAMEFIDGEGLEKIIARSGRLEPARAAMIGAQVADALDFAHKNSVVHRDIKPANIMIEPGDRVKVADFGIAKVTNSGDHLTMTGSLLGTPSYMSPEQARGSELDGRSDLFSVGCVLYEMLTGKKAFSGESITGLIFKIITEEPPPIREISPNVPEALTRVVAKALAKAPEQRYASGRELADDLLEFVAPGTTPTLRQSETPTAPGIKGPAIEDLPTIQAALTVSRASTPLSPPPPKPGPAPRTASGVASAAAPMKSPAPPTPAPRSSAGLLIAAALGGALLLGAGAVAGWFFFGRGRSSLTGEQRVAEAMRIAKAVESAVPTPSPLPSPSPENTTATVTTPALTIASAPPPKPAPQPQEAHAVAPEPRPAPPSPAAGSHAVRAEPVSIPPAPAHPDAAATRGSPLDEEPPELVEGAEAGRRVADSFRSRQGGSSFGASGRFKPREHSPHNVTPVERPSVATLRYLMNAQELFHQRHGRYGSFADLIRAQALAMDVPTQAHTFQRKGYRFELRLEPDGYRVTAVPLGPGPRPFVGDETGFIRAGLE